MATKSFRIFATKEDLFSIFFDFQQNVKIHYFKCGRMYDLVEISDITKDTLFGINQKGNLLNSQYLNEEERSRVIQSLIELKNNLATQGRYTDAVDDVLCKVLGAKKKKLKIEYI